MLKELLFKKKFSAKIIGHPRIENNEVVCLVKMKGLAKPIYFNAKDIIYNFSNKFSQQDIRIAALAYQKKLKKKFKLKTLFNEIAEIINIETDTQYYIDLAKEHIHDKIDLDDFDSYDAYRLGMQAERIRQQKDSKAYETIKKFDKVELRVINGKKAI